MNKIEKLINELCPNGVEFRKIGDFVDYIQPTKYIVNDTNYKNNGVPVLTAGKTFILGYTNENYGIYEINNSGPVIIFDDFTGSFHWVNFNFKVKSSALKILIAKENINFRYIYHYMVFINLNSAEHKRLWITKYSQLSIPIPPISIQNKIVEILDKYTELELRNKRYTYYQNELPRL